MIKYILVSSTVFPELYKQEWFNECTLFEVNAHGEDIYFVPEERYYELYPKPVLRIDFVAYCENQYNPVYKAFLENRNEALNDDPMAKIFYSLGSSIKFDLKDEFKSEIGELMTISASFDEDLPLIKLLEFQEIVKKAIMEGGSTNIPENKIFISIKLNTNESV